MQTKEKKWAEVENYLITLYDNNEELFYKMQELKLTVDNEVLITNVITENERLKKLYVSTKQKLHKLRKRLTNPYFISKIRHEVDEVDTSSDGQNKTIK